MLPKQRLKKKRKQKSKTSHPSGNLEEKGNQRED